MNFTNISDKDIKNKVDSSGSNSDTIMVVFYALLGTAIFAVSVYVARVRKRRYLRNKNRALKYLDNSISKENDKKDSIKHCRISDKKRALSECIKVKNPPTQKNNIKKEFKRSKTISKRENELIKMKLEKDTDKNSTDSQNSVNNQLKIIGRSPFKIQSLENKIINGFNKDNQKNYENILFSQSNSITKNEIYMGKDIIGFNELSKVKIKRKFQEPNFFSNEKSDLDKSQGDNTQFQINNSNVPTESYDQNRTTTPIKEKTKYEFKINLVSLNRKNQENKLDIKSSNRNIESYRNSNMSKLSEFEEKILEMGEECVENNIDNIEKSNDINFINKNQENKENHSRKISNHYNEPVNLSLSVGDMNDIKNSNENNFIAVNNYI